MVRPILVNLLFITHCYFWTPEIQLRADSTGLSEFSVPKITWQLCSNIDS